VKQEPKADNDATLGYFLTSSLAGCANRRRHQETGQPNRRLELEGELADSDFSLRISAWGCPLNTRNDAKALSRKTAIETMKPQIDTEQILKY